ncbi:hypothetical protein BgiBS90_015720 [Biomphalaria glabrata]|nr:hypothetical protein BgiBS90_015720 [Biomphalaria glabrata]
MSCQVFVWSGALQIITQSLQKTHSIAFIYQAGHGSFSKDLRLLWIEQHVKIWGEETDAVSTVIQTTSSEKGGDSVHSVSPRQCSSSLPHAHRHWRKDASNESEHLVQTGGGATADR